MYKKNVKCGFSFSQACDNRAVLADSINAVPGPGYYIIKRDVTKPKSISFSIPIDNGGFNVLNSPNIPSDIPFLNSE